MYMHTHTHMHIPLERCMGVCAFGDCFLQCTICLINLTHFKVIRVGRETLLGKSSKLWKEIKKSLLGRKKKSVKHRPRAIMMRFP